MRRQIFLGGEYLEYITVEKEGTDFFITKKSKFIGHCMPVKTQEEAQGFIKQIKAQHKDATHNVWAYSLKEGMVQRYSDDGEPQGTAGIPVLDVLKKSGTVNAALVVTRYFGGTLLGAGGLVRAYSHGGSIAVAAATQIVMKQCIVLSAKTDYSHYAKLQELIEEIGAVIEDTLFEEAVTVQFHALPESLKDFSAKFADLTAGKGMIKEISQQFHGFPYNK